MASDPLRQTGLSLAVQKLSVKPRAQSIIPNPNVAITGENRPDQCRLNAVGDAVWSSDPAVALPASVRRHLGRCDRRVIGEQLASRIIDSACAASRTPSRLFTR